MAFGQHQFQHRFFKNISHKKPALLVPSGNHVLPLLGSNHLEQSRSSPTPQQQTIYPVYLKTRAYQPQLAVLRQENQRVYSEPSSQTIQQYRSNAAMLERFQQQADDYKHRMKFRHLKRSQDSSAEVYQSIPQATKTEGNQQFERSIFAYNPQVIVPMRPVYDQATQLKLAQQTAQLKLAQSKLERYEREKSWRVSELEREGVQSRIRLKEYKRKYGRLKNKLRKQLEERKNEEIMRVITKQYEAADNERKKLAEIKALMANISDSLSKNTEILNSSIKVQQQITLNNSSIVSKKSSLSEKKANSRGFLPTLEHSSINAYQAEEESPLRSPPTVVYTKKSIDSSLNMQSVKQNLKEVNFRLNKLKL